MGAGASSSPSLPGGDWAPLAAQLSALPPDALFSDDEFPAHFDSIGSAIKNAAAYKWCRPAEWLTADDDAATDASLFGASGTPAPSDVLQVRRARARVGFAR